MTVSPEEVLDEARAKGWTIATAESCTGGMLSAALTDVPGASDVFSGAVVSYSNEVKIGLLKVRPTTLTEHGAVSQAVARQMAAGVYEQTGARLTIAITGIAGPGGSGHKPEGRVCFAVASPDFSHAETVEFGAIGRQNVRQGAVDRALDLLMMAMTQ
ncbi:CinA family protein [Aliiroseovarius sp. PTFE2010]|uniref:CinA family protein n=1 Tax=Aliiroseovarius sp. PTFE2010 TaxID=3417190 RepID=UPI003CF22F29